MSGNLRGTTAGVSVALESVAPLRGTAAGVQVFEEGHPHMRATILGSDVYFVARDVDLRATAIGVSVFMDIAPDPHARPPEVIFFE